MKDNSSHIDNLIARYLAGEASQEEIKELLHWMDTSPENEKYFEGIKFVHDKAIASHRIEKVNIDNAWQKLSSQMLSMGEGKSDKVFRMPVYRKPWFRIAAAVLLIAGITSLMYLIVKNPAAEQVMLTAASNDTIITRSLSPELEVTLNRNSQVTYKRSRDKKEIELKGEAFIEVHHSTDTPLIVKAGEVLIRDIGTSFNVKAYGDSSFVEVFVKTGEVAVYTESIPGLTLKAGETGIYDKLNKIFYRPDAADINSIAYKSKLFVFYKTSLAKALSALNSVYSQKFELANPDLAKCTITVTFDQESPEAIADIIAEPWDFRFKRGQ
ncbi:MAG: hypothetical protein HC830_02385 [Bacteroidetes bacterium]|nr:hypothetical protein [Bacteroidota bacterium]